jgi:hypothetical protein
MVYVQFGTLNGGSTLVLTGSNATPIVVGTSNQTWYPSNGIQVNGISSSNITPPSASNVDSIVIGKNARSTLTGAPGSIAIGTSAQANSGAPGTIVIGASAGCYSQSFDAGVVLGYAAQGAGSGVVIGNQAFGADSIGNQVINNTVIGALARSDSASTSSRQYVTIIGAAAVTGASNSSIIGSNGRSFMSGEFALGLGWFSTQGDATTSTVMAYQTTTTSATTELGVSIGTATTTPSTRITLVNDSTYLFDCDIVARNTATDTQSKTWNVKFAIRRGAAAANTALIGTPTTVVFGEDSGTETWAISVTADTTNGRPNISVTGETSKTIRWVANIRLTKVTG